MSIPLYEPILAYHQTLCTIYRSFPISLTPDSTSSIQDMQKNAYLVCLNESIQIIIELSLYISCIFIRFDLLALSWNEC